VSADSHTSVLSGVAAYYSSKLAEHGPTARGVDWNSEASQTQRHQQFLHLLGNEWKASILDLGCGYGDFFRFLHERGFRGTYIGYDIVPEMIAEARRKHGADKDRLWRVGAAPNETADYAIASGILNVKGEISMNEWTDHVYHVIDMLARAARYGFGFNMLSLASAPERRRPDLYYADPTAMLNNCIRRFGRQVTLLQDYGLWEFTLVIRKEPDGTN
jgi:SAM-dependent methyltransferase